LPNNACQLRSHFKRLDGNSLEKLAGNFFELAGKQQGILWKNRELSRSRKTTIRNWIAQRHHRHRFSWFLLDESLVKTILIEVRESTRTGWMSPQRFVRGRWDLADAS
jgi:hypothetical protein